MCSVLRFTRSLFARRMIQRRFRVLQIYAPAPGPFQKLTRIDVSEGCRRCSELERGRRHIHLLSFIFAPPRSAGRRRPHGAHEDTDLEKCCFLQINCTIICSAVLSFLHEYFYPTYINVLSFSCTKKCCTIISARFFAT